MGLRVCSPAFSPTQYLPDDSLADLFTQSGVVEFLLALE